MSEAEARIPLDDDKLFEIHLSKKQKELEKSLSEMANTDLSQLDSLPRIATLALAEMDLCKKTLRITPEQRETLGIPIEFTFEGLEEGDPAKIKESLLKDREVAAVVVQQLCILYILLANALEKSALRFFNKFGMNTASLTAFSDPSGEGTGTDETGDGDEDTPAETETGDNTGSIEGTEEAAAGEDSPQGGSSGEETEGEDTNEGSASVGISESEDPADPAESNDGGSGKAETEDGANGQGTDPKKKGTPRRKKGCLDAQEDGLPTIVVHMPFPPEELEKLGLVRYKTFPDSACESLTRIVFVPPQIYKEKYIFEKLADKDSNKIYSSKKCYDIQRDFRKSRMSYDLQAEILTQRYVNILSGPQVAQEFTSWNYAIDRRKVYEVVSLRTQDTFRWVAYRMLQLAWFRKAVQCDETYEKDLDSPGKNRYMWQIRTSEYSEGPQIVVFIYGPGRDEGVLENKVFKGFIDNFNEGDPPMWVMCDAYEVYPELERKHPGMFVICGCMSHSRAKFVDVLKTIVDFKLWDEDKKMNESAAYQAVVRWRAIFMDERARKDMSVEERKASRQGVMKKQVDEFFCEWLPQFKPNVTHMKGGLLDIAINYMKNREPYFRRLLENGEVPINNSASERQFIHLARFRDMSKQFGSEKGGDDASFVFTVLATAMENGADPRIYFAFLMRKVPELLRAHGIDPNMKEIDKSIDYGFLDELMPWSDTYKAFEAEEKRKGYERTLAFARMFSEYGL